MPNNLAATAGADATLPATSVIATQQLGDGSHAGVAVIIDPADRTKMLKPAADGSIAVTVAALPLPSTAATSTLQSAAATLTGAVTETAPASDTASSGLNGRLQRIAQRLSSIIALLPTALGANGGLKIEGVPSGTAVPVSGTVTVTGVATQTTLAALSATDGLLADANWDGATASPTKQSILRAVWAKLEAIRVAVTDATAVNAVRAIKDTSRTSIAINADEYQTSAVAITLVNTMKVSKAGGTAATIATGYTVTSGKVFRITYISVQVSTTTNNTTAVRPTVRIHIKAGGAAGTGDPILNSVVLVSSATALGAGGVTPVSIPDGFELAAGDGISVSIQTPGWVVNTAAPLLTVNITGFEYTP